MPDVDSPDLDDLPLATVEHIDGACEAFERAWRAGHRPALGPYVETVPAAGRTALLRQLLLIDFEYRTDGRPELAGYLAAYPELADSLRRAYPAAAPPPPRAALPERVGGYRIVRELGRGGMGVVYEAVQLALGRYVALKVLAPRVTTGSEEERFRREAAVAARLHHTNIVPVYEAGRDGDTCFYAMQYIRGRDLQRFIAEARVRRGWEARRPEAGVRGQTHAPLPAAEPTTPVGRLPWDAELAGPGYFARVAEVAAQVADALAHAHAGGAVHRDIKPTNILLDDRGIVWVTDFGLVKTLDADLTAPGAVIGTLRYLGPERLGGRCDARSDVYSLGLTLYELACLRPAFAGNDYHQLLRALPTADPPRPRAVDRRVPRDLETVILKAADKEPARRYQTAAELAADLRRFAAGEPVLARRAGPLRRLWRLARRNPLPAAAAAAVLLGLAAVTASAVWAEATARRHLAEVTAERDATRRALTRADGLRLVALSEVTRPADPGLALHLAAAGADRAPGPLAANAVQAALDDGWERRTLAGHAGAVVAVAFGPAARVATGGADGTARVWDADTGAELLRVDAPGVARVALSPDGRRLLTLSGGPEFGRTAVGITGGGPSLTWDRPDGPAVALWDAATGRRLARWQPPRPPAVCWWAYAAGLGFSGDGRRVLSFHGTHPGGHPAVHDADTGRPISLLAGPTPVLAAALAPDGRSAAVAAADGLVRVFDADTGAIRHTLAGHRSAVTALAFDPAGRRLLTIGSGKTLTLPPVAPPAVRNSPDDAPARVWDATTGTLLAALRWPDVERVPAKAGIFSADGADVVLATGRDGRRVWDAATGRPGPPLVATLAAGRLGPAADEADLPAAPRLGRWAELADGGRVAVFVGTDRVPRVAVDGLLVPLRGHTDRAGAAAVSPDGTRLVTAAADGTARVWERPTAAGVPGGGVWATPVSAVSPAGDRVLVRRNPPTAADLLDAATGRPVARVDGEVLSAAFGPDGRLTLGGRNRLRRLRADGSVELDAAVPGRAVAVSPGDRRAAVAEPADDGGGERVRVWDLAGSREVTRFALPAGRLTAAAFSPDGTRLVTYAEADPDSPARVWDADTGAERPPGGRVPWAAFVGDRLLTFHLGVDDPFRLSDPADGAVVRTFTNRALHPGGPWNFPLDRLRQFRVDPAGRRLLANPHGGRVGVWDLGAGGEPVVTLAGHAGDVTFAGWADGGNRVVTGGADRTARLWDAAAGRELAVFRGHEAAVTAADLSAAGDRLVTGSADGTVRLWAADGREVVRVGWRHGAVDEVRFTPDGRRVVVRGREGARLWELDVTAVARSRLPRALTAEERERYELPAR